MTGATPFFDVDEIRDVVGALVEDGATVAEMSETSAAACSSPCSGTPRAT
jgi:hypothetical protein